MYVGRKLNYTYTQFAYYMAVIHLQPVAMKFLGPENDRMEAVVNAFRHAWQAYRRYAWGHDELLPITRSHAEWFGVGLTLVDALDTMYVMGLEEGMSSLFLHRIHEM